MSIFKNICISIMIVSVLGCEEPEIIIPPFEVETSGKTVLIEELTGVRCPNCPSANARLEAVQLLYGDQVVVVGIHGELLTKPLEESQYDFRNQAAIDLENKYKPFIGKPSVVINRKLHPAFNLIANPVQSQWQSIIEDELQLEQEISITSDVLIENENYIINIGVLPLTNIASPVDIHIYLTESHLLDAQEDVDRIILDYEHNHVLRKTITDLSGERISESMTANQVINYSTTITPDDLNATWVEENLELVLFVTDNDDVVIQASLIHLIN